MMGRILMHWIIENFKDVVGFLANIITIVGIGFVIKQLKEASEANKLAEKDYNVKNEKSEREKAIELSKFYCDHILPKTSYLFNVLKDAGIDKVLGDINYTDLKEFDQAELNQLLGVSKVKELKNFFSNINIKILMDNMPIIRDLSIEEYLEDINTITYEKITGRRTSLAEEEAVAETESENREKEMIDKIAHAYHVKKHRNEYMRTLEDCLNLLEYFCMSFNNGIADEETVYQSLHQSFLGTVKLVYFHIAIQNTTGKDKYYTNIIKLFNKWSIRHNEQQMKEIELQRGTIHEKKSIEK